MRIEELSANCFKVTYRFKNKKYAYTRYASANAAESLKVINRMYDNGDRENFLHWVNIYDRVCAQAIRTSIIKKWRKYGYDVVILSVESIESF